MNNSRTHLKNEFINDEKNEEDEEEQSTMNRFKNCITCKKVNTKSIQVN